MGKTLKVKLQELDCWFSPQEAAKVIGCSQSYLRQKKEGEVIKGFHIGSWKRENNPNWPVWSAILSRPVRCMETNQCFPSLSSAGKEKQVHPNEISCCCRGLKDTAGGFHWEFIEKQ